jgi:RNA polymerase sigma factor (TIGR02999 family)
MDSDVRLAPITELLIKVKAGDRKAEAELAPLVYKELRALAAYYMRRERPNHTLQPTALMHEAYLRLMGQDQIDWTSRTHFFAVAANMMRRILVDYARARRAAKRGSGGPQVSLTDAMDLTLDPSWEKIIDVDEALLRLTEIDERQARVVELRFFAGLEVDEVADVLGISSRTVKRDWQFAQSWLYGQLGAAYRKAKPPNAPGSGANTKSP